MPKFLFYKKKMWNNILYIAVWALQLAILLFVSLIMVPVCVSCMCRHVRVGFPSEFPKVQRVVPVESPVFVEDE